jgi:radical SAM protein with 4Fe4S-binding SPASM domain
MICTEIPSLSYSEFRQHFGQKIDRQRIPIKGSLELTFRCNLRCQHCYVEHGHTGITGKQELGLDEIQRIFDEIADAGCLWLLLTGGEPLIRKDFKEIFKAARNNGFLVSLFTNATLVDQALADFLATWHPFQIEISLYGATPQTYERVTGIPGSYQRARHGIELLLERKLPIALKTVVMTLNQHELKDMQAYAASLGVRFRYDPMVNAGLAGQDHPRNLRISPEEIVQLDKQDEQRLLDAKRLYDRIIQKEYDRKQLYACSAGISSFHIDPFGDVTLCMLARQVALNLRQMSFMATWEKLAEVRQTPAGCDYACRSCKLLSLCGQCPGWSQVEFGNSTQPVEFMCQVAHLREMNYRQMAI